MDQILNFWKAYPSSAFASENLRLQTVTGDSSLRCAVSFVSLSIILLHSKHSRKRTIMASSWNRINVQTWTYRYNQPDPIGGSTATAHAAENYMMFRGTHTGYSKVSSFVAF